MDRQPLAGAALGLADLGAAHLARKLTAIALGFVVAAQCREVEPLVRLNQVDLAIPAAALGETELEKRIGRAALGDDRRHFLERNIKSGHGELNSYPYSSLEMLPRRVEGGHNRTMSGLGLRRSKFDALLTK